MTCPLFDEEDISVANVVVIDVTEKTTRMSTKEDLPDYYEDDTGFEVGNQMLFCFTCIVSSPW